ncbi:unnamed protein product [Rotaria magnacalcarata]|uniref:MACPF domain-containing protein n=2 Tax=Rotaria magnacalcarata TaxID=392030 RepID=A0A816QTT6_9BILA|nr:unnamed protein product [Rotaria magnacalcarata]CAF4032770.1 unnamed protein product [Rotaria magnacalcarata]
MIKTLILLIASIAVIEGSYSCPQSNGTFQNDDDYRSYHACTNYCDRVTYCLQTNEYYSAIERTCKRDEFNWLPGYDLTGTQLIMPLVQYRHFQQSRYDVYWTSETLNHQFDFMGRYINETHVIGTETILSLRTKCVFIAMKIHITLSFLICTITSSLAYLCPTLRGTYPHEWNKAAYYRCSRGCDYQESCPPDTFYSNETSKCEMKPGTWSPYYDLTGRNHWNNIMMEIIQTSYDVQWMFIFSIILQLLLVTSSYCQGDIPGLDDIASGYDAAKMISASEQNSKYRIFDFSDVSTTPYKIKIFGKDREFTRPRHVQIVDISFRRQSTCETVAYTFETFFRSYCRSTSFGIGMGLPGVASVAIGYSKTLKEIEQSMKRNDRAVGVSSTWWGFYSIQIAPPFLMKLDPMFAESVELLATEASNPSNEDHQTLYNQFIQTFGTHYVSRVIVGGTAYLYSIMEASFHNKSSYREVSSQVSLMFQYKSRSFNVGETQASVMSKMTETFKKNTESLAVFQPPIPNDEGKSDWEVWQRRASEHPVVVNRTLFSIDSLIRGKPRVQEHLRRTIQFYLKDGIIPTLAQLSGRSTGRRVSIEYKPRGPIHGLDVVGCGYNILKMENKFCIFDQSNFTENERWSDPYNKNLTYSVPNGWFVVNTPESLTLDGEITVTSVEDYFRSKITVTVSRSGGWLGIGRRTSRKTVAEFYRRFYQDYYNLVLRMKQIGWYTLSVSAFPYPKLNPIVQKALDGLPVYFNVSDIKIWEEFFEAFGTHVVVSSNMGGQVWAETWYEKCLTYEHSQRWIDEQVSKNWFGIRVGVKNIRDYSKTVDERFKQHSIFTSELLGGTESIDPSEWEKWAPTIKAKPRAISYRLLALAEILPPGDLRNAVKAAINYILTTAQKEEHRYIDQLKSMRDPPQRKCSRNEIRTKRSSETTPEEEAKKQFCPYIGYKGQECLGSQIKGRSLIAANATRLPIGVGMTLDITTGRLLLPALENNFFGNNYWIDPNTNRMHQAPRGIIFPRISQDENRPISRVFLSAAELSNEWKYERLRGSWLGGEFGHSKSLLDIYSRFFSKNQATAITQKPTVLYRLRVENLRLNQYAREAVEKLPAVYNETLYDDFIQNWGTHIVQQALVGGMREQQVLFKDCVFSFNGAITSDNLNEYLRRDILSQTLGNSFYADRRKINVDHIVGGDPTEKNETRWLQTLAANPALLKIEEYVPWSDLIQINPSVRENLRRIIRSRTAAADQIRMDEENQLNEQRFNGSHLEKDGYIGLLSNGVCNIIPTTFGSVKDCSEGCATHAMVRVSQDFLDNQQLFYVRDETTGFIRSRARIDGQTVLEGPLVNAGCSSIATGREPTVSAHICVSCDLVNSFQNQCVCVCPRYPPSS